MMDTLFWILLLLVTAALIFIAAKLYMFFKAYHSETLEIYRKMGCAADEGTYQRWHLELRCHYLYLIPFVNEKNVMRVYQFLFRKRPAKQKKHKDGLMPLLMPSVLGIFFCMICICSMTWAWFSSTSSSATVRLQAARFDATVQIEGVEPDAQGYYTLPVGEHSVTLTAEGDASGGYCLIEIFKGEEKIENLYSAQLYTKPQEGQKSSQTFRISVENGEVRVKFSSAWGSVDEPRISGLIQVSGTAPEEQPEENPEETPLETPENNAPVQEPPEEKEPQNENEYIVQSGDKLSEIAEKCGTTAEKLAAFNKLESFDSIKAGQVLQIPPKDYELPAEEQPEQPADSSAPNPPDSENAGSEEVPAPSEEQPTLPAESETPSSEAE